MSVIWDKTFQRTVYAYYSKNGRSFPWRATRDSYLILVSEVMLQQTPVARVLLKYRVFIEHFPTMEALARAPFKAVLSVWQGLGYNRRALFLHHLAQIVVHKHRPALPRTVEQLQGLPGIGQSTAAAVCAFAYNVPVVFCETNIRSVYLHCFFRGKTGISDRQLLPIIEQTLDRQDPRTWYYALFDYGAMLKEKYENPSRASLHYARQSPFEGSRRQVRAQTIAFVLDHPGSTLAHLRKAVPRVTLAIVETLITEGFLQMRNKRLHIPS